MGRHFEVAIVLDDAQQCLQPLNFIKEIWA